VGQIVGSFGIKGQVKVQLLTDFIDCFDQGRRVLFRGAFTEIESSGFHSGKFIIKLDSISDRSEADDSQWEYIDIPGDKLPELDEDEYRTIDLIGMEVATEEGETLGVIDDVMESPAHDIIVVGPILIPAVKEFIRKIDLKGNKMIVKLIEGMRP